MARPLFREIVEKLYRGDRFLRGTLSIGFRRIGPELVQAPLLAVVDPRCRLVPLRAVRPFLEAARNTESTIIEYGGEVGVALQHVGMLVGREAHRTLWPAILGWLLGRCPSR